MNYYNHFVVRTGEIIKFRFVFKPVIFPNRKFICTLLFAKFALFNGVDPLILINWID